jgi:hypothetical protein
VCAVPRGKFCRPLYGALTMPPEECAGAPESSRLMRVDHKSPLSTAGAPAAQRRGAAAGRFTLAGKEPFKSAGVAASAPLATVDALLALQGQDDAAERKRRSVKRGNDLLDALDRLKAALLSGRVSTADLQLMAARIAERRELTGDAGLDELLSHIDLRAQVEMAKLGIADRRSPEGSRNQAATTRL